MVIGMPIWASAPPPAVKRYVETVDLTGRKVSAFCTHDGGGGKRTFAALSALLGAELVATLDLKKPKPDDPALDERLARWAEQLKADTD